MRRQSEPSKSKNKAVVSNGSARKKGSHKVVIRYTECRKNHAASIGGYAVDGCREFMASGQDGTAAALLCAACACHRSFHKRDFELDSQTFPGDCSSASTYTSSSEVEN